MKANEVTFAALIDGYCKAGKNDCAHALFEKMLEEKCLPNSCVYNVLIDGLCKERKLKEASLLLDKMTNSNVQPDLCTYSIMINGLLKDGYLDDACRVLEQMHIAGCRPDACTYTTFIHANCSRGNLEEAENWIKIMNEGGILPDVVTYTVLIDGYGRLGSLSQAFGALKRMMDIGCEPSEFTYSILIKHFLNSKRSTSDGKGTVMDVHLNAISADVVDVWRVVNFETVIELLNDMTKHGCAPTISTYNTFIDGFCQRGQIKEAQLLIDHMRHGGIQPGEVISNSIIKCCCMLELYAEAFQLINNMVTMGELPHLESFKLLICGLYEKGHKDQAEAIFCSLLRCGYNNDEIAWKVLIDGLQKKGLVDSCSELIKVMESNGCHPKPHTYSMLIEGLLSGSEGK